MDLFWLRLGMEKDTVKDNREKAIKRMRAIGAKKVAGMKAVVEKYEGTKKEGQSLKKESAKPRPKKVKKISLK